MVQNFSENKLIEKPIIVNRFDKSDKNNLIQLHVYCLFTMKKQVWNVKR